MKRKYNHTASRMTSDGNWWRANEIVVIRHHNLGSETHQSFRVNARRITRGCLYGRNIWVIGREIEDRLDLVTDREENVFALLRHNNLKSQG